MVRECIGRGHRVRIYAIHWLDENPPPQGVELCLAPGERWPTIVFMKNSRLGCNAILSGGQWTWWWA